MITQKENKTTKLFSFKNLYNFLRYFYLSQIVYISQKDIPALNAKNAQTDLPKAKYKSLYKNED